MTFKTIVRVLLVLLLALCIVLLNNALYTAKHPAYRTDLSSTVTPTPEYITLFDDIAHQAYSSNTDGANYRQHLHNWLAAIANADHMMVTYQQGKVVDQTLQLFYAREDFNNTPVPANLIVLHAEIDTLFIATQDALRALNNNDGVAWRESRYNMIQSAYRIRALLSDITAPAS